VIKRAHRLLFETLNGPIENGLVIDHMCNNRGCVNPEHLQKVSQKINTNRANTHMGNINKNKIVCINGHPYDTVNTNNYFYKGKPRRRCLACHADRERTRRANKQKDVQNGI
jgi:hypothetical protein